MPNFPLDVFLIIAQYMENPWVLMRVNKTVSKMINYKQERLKDGGLRTTRFGQLEGPQIEIIYDDYSGLISSKLEYFIFRGKKHGIYKHFRATLQSSKVEYWIYKKCYYRFGELDGVCKIFYSSGKPKVISHYKNGKLHGLYLEWYQNGRTSRESNYEDGQLHGNVLTYHENGAMMEIANYNKGKRERHFQSYYDNGQTLAKGFYKDGRLIGDYVEYYRNGTIREKAKYYDGSPTKVKLFDEKGNIKKMKVDFLGLYEEDWNYCLIS